MFLHSIQLTFVGLFLNMQQEVPAVSFVNCIRGICPVFYLNRKAMQI